MRLFGKKYCTPKYLTQRVNVVHFFVCRHRLAVRGMVSYPKEERFRTRLSNAMTPDSLRPYIPFLSQNS